MLKKSVAGSQLYHLSFKCCISSLLHSVTGIMLPVVTKLYLLHQVTNIKKLYQSIEFQFKIHVIPTFKTGCLPFFRLSCTLPQE